MAEDMSLVSLVGRIHNSEAIEVRRFIKDTVQSDLCVAARDKYSSTLVSALQDNISRPNIGGLVSDSSAGTAQLEGRHKLSAEQQKALFDVTQNKDLEQYVQLWMVPFRACCANIGEQEVSAKAEKALSAVFTYGVMQAAANRLRGREGRGVFFITARYYQECRGLARWCGRSTTLAPNSSVDSPAVT